ncbi:MAG: hypothetical protein R6V67_12025 [Spirochaetia bacterium]
MKKRNIFYALIFFLLIAGVAGAETSEFFVKTVPVNKVYQHRLGYRVAYPKSDHTMGILYIPHKWFNREADTEEVAKAELATGSGPAYPYLSIFWKNGEFHHIRLYVKQNLQDVSYGQLDNPEAFNDRFDVDTLDPEF